jgi:hypothetical protein
MSVIRENIGGIASTVIGGAILFFVGIWWSNRENRIRHLEYYSTISPDILSGIRELGDSATVMIKNDSVKQVLSLEIAVLNNSDKDFEDVPLFVELTSNNDSEIKILSSNYYDHNNAKESVQVDRVEKSRNKIRYGYHLDNVNRLKTPVFRTRFFIDGTIAPDVSVQVSKVGLGEVNQFQFNDRTIEVSGFFAMFIIVFSLVMAGICVYFIRGIRVILRESRAKIRNEIH